MPTTWERLPNSSATTNDPNSDFLLESEDDEIITGRFENGIEETGGGGDGRLVYFQPSQSFFRSSSTQNFVGFRSRHRIQLRKCGLVSIMLSILSLLCLIVLLSIKHNRETTTATNVMKINNGEGEEVPFIEPFDDDNANANTHFGVPNSALTPTLQLVHDMFEVFTNGDDPDNVTNVTLPLPIIIAYEFRSRASRIFLSHQFFPTYYALAKYIRPILVPYGHSTITQNPTNPTIEHIELTCENGPDECAGNLINACAIKHTNWNDSLSVTRLMMFVECMVNETSSGSSDGGTGPTATQLGTNCAKNTAVYWEDIQKCTVDGEGLRVMESLKNMTETYVGNGGKDKFELPFVLVAGHKTHGQWKIQGQFKSFICEAFLKKSAVGGTNQVLKECNNNPNRTKV